MGAFKIRARLGVCNVTQALKVLQHPLLELSGALYRRPIKLMTPDDYTMYIRRPIIFISEDNRNGVKHFGFLPAVPEGIQPDCEKRREAARVPESNQI